MSRFHERLWSSDPRLALRFLSVCLAPAEQAYRLAVTARNWGYSKGLLRSGRAAIPAVAVGNLTVGGTGKTPVAAWIARRLQAAGRSPTVVMRGYGGDEETVHRLLNPSIPVCVSADRIKATKRAAEAGADVAVLDDAFQHRALRANAYIVLIAAEEWVEEPRLLPRGPWREPLTALRRAQLLVVTRKIAPPAEALRVCESLARHFPATPLAQAYIGVSKLACYEEGQLQILPSAMGFRAALAVAGVARADAVWEQLRKLGISMDHCSAFPDHHRFRARDIAAIKEATANGPLIATLKDAVKLRPLLPTDMAIYVPLQQVEWEAGGGALDHLLAGVVEEHATRLEFSK